MMRRNAPAWEAIPGQRVCGDDSLAPSASGLQQRHAIHASAERNGGVVWELPRMGGAELVATGDVWIPVAKITGLLRHRGGARAGAQLLL
jgi:hypothetical protein